MFPYLWTNASVHLSECFVYFHRPKKMPTWMYFCFVSTPCLFFFFYSSASLESNVVKFYWFCRVNYTWNLLNPLSWNQWNLLDNDLTIFFLLFAFPKPFLLEHISQISLDQTHVKLTWNTHRLFPNLIRILFCQPNYFGDIEWWLIFKWPGCERAASATRE